VQLKDERPGKGKVYKELAYVHGCSTATVCRILNKKDSRHHFEGMQELENEGVSVYDPFLKQSYVSKWFLGTVSADTPARNVVGKFSGVSGFRADYRSLFQGAKFSNINSDGTYFTGYCAP
jgi:hypothetical protein